MTVILYIYSGMNQPDQQFTLDELASLVELPRRTVRYYIQIGLIDRPGGVGRGAHYNKRHLEQLIEIRKWQDAGLSLDRIRELLTVDESSGPIPPLKPRQKGSLEVHSHLLIDKGVELVIDPSRSELSPEDARKFADGVMKLYKKIRSIKEN